MTDRELLELAAKVAGLNVGTDEGAYDDLKWWNPLNDDGDALRLAVKLGIDLQFRGMTVINKYCFAKRGSVEIEEEAEYTEADPMVAVRRAIVRAAAEIGRGD